MSEFFVVIRVRTYETLMRTRERISPMLTFNRDDEDRSGAPPKRPPFTRLSAQDRILFAKRLGLILRSGTPILEGLRMLASQARTRSSRHVYEHIIHDIEHGRSLSSALGRYTDIFGEFCVNIVRIGEESGTLHHALEYLADELKKKQQLRRKVIGALIYPTLIIVATTGITLFLTVYIFPKITPVFASINAELPITTRALIGISNWLIANGLALTVGAVIALSLFLLSLRISAAHRAFDALLIRMPIIGRLSSYYNLASMARTLGLLLKSDVGVVHALGIVADGTRNRAYRARIRDVREKILQGALISSCLKEQHRYFPGMFTQMISVGESTGTLPSSLMYLSNMYEEEIDDLTKNLTTMLEPVLMITMGIIVGFIAISIVTPIYSVTQNLSAYK